MSLPTRWRQTKGWTHQDGAHTRDSATPRSVLAGHHGTPRRCRRRSVFYKHAKVANERILRTLRNLTQLSSSFPFSGPVAEASAATSANLSTVMEDEEAEDREGMENRRERIRAQIELGHCGGRRGSTCFVRHQDRHTLKKTSRRTTQQDATNPTFSA